MPDTKRNGSDHNLSPIRWKGNDIVFKEEDMEPYVHVVQYYETDKMGITHHSNYIRWMEEARIDFLRQIGWDYEKLEEEGLASPVTAVDCKYKGSTTFPDKIGITIGVSDYDGVRLKLRYIMTHQDSKIVCEAHSEHCFLDKDGRFARMAKEYPDLHDTLISLKDRGE